MDIFRVPILTARDAARHLGMPESTLDAWLRPIDGGEPLVHSIVPERRGWPRVPFVGVIEAHALRRFRDVGISMSEIRRIVEIVREDTHDEYALASRRIAALVGPGSPEGTDSRLFARLRDDSLVNQHQQMAIRETVEAHLRDVAWNDEGQPMSLRLAQYPDRAAVIIDPRFAWGSPVVASTRTPVQAVVELWHAGESMTTVAEEFGLDPDVVEDICRVAA